MCGGLMWARSAPSSRFLVHVAVKGSQGQQGDLQRIDLQDLLHIGIFRLDLLELRLECPLLVLSTLRSSVSFSSST